MSTSSTPTTTTNEKNHSVHPHRLRNTFLLATIIGFTILVATFITGAKRMQERHIEESLSEEFSIVKQEFTIQKTETKKMLAALCDAICLNPTTQKLWLEGDRQKLLADVEPLYEKIFQAANITHLYFHTIEGVNFLRAHEPSQFGDKIERNTMLQAQYTNQASYGLELGPFGTLTLRYVQPWHIDGKLTGYIELGKEIDNVYQTTTDLLGGSSAVLLLKKNLDEKDWKKGMAFLKRPGSWDQYPDYVVIGQHPAGKPLPFVDRLLKEQNATGYLPSESYNTSDGNTYQVGAVEIKDMEGRLVGYFAFERDITASVAATRSFIRTLVLLTVAVAILIAFLGSRLLSREEKQLHREHQRLEEQLTFQSLQSTIIARFVDYDPSEWDALVDESLKEICQSVHANGAYTVGYFDSEDQLSHVHGWSVDRSDEVKQLFQQLKLEDAQWWIRMLDKKKPIIITGNEISPEADVPQHMYHKFNIKTLLAVPLHYSDKVRGWLLVSHRDQPMHWKPKQMERMESVADILATAIARRRIEETVQNYTKKLSQTNIRLEQAKARAEESSQAKSKFLANMSHEIRTPMTAILGFAENLVATKISDEERIEAADTIYRNGKHLLEIINDILDFSKVESGQIRLEKIACPLIRVISDVVMLMEKRAKEKSIFIKSEFEGSMPEECLSDPTRIRQILLNLTGNAIKFTEQGGVTIFSKMVKDDDGKPLFITEVTDTGIGMDEKQLSQIFQPFTQADSSMTRRFGGTGLGLAISLRLAQAMGGDLTVESTKGVSTTFRLSVPVEIKEGTKWIDDPENHKFSPPPKPQEKITGTGEGRLPYKILLAEDGKDNQRVISILLRREGADITIVENGSEAIRAIEHAQMEDQPFDLVLMDIQMPILDGYAATRRLRQAGFHLPIIALTASVMPEDRNRCLAAGCDDYTSKPIQRESFFATIEKNINKEHAMPT